MVAETKYGQTMVSFLWEFIKENPDMTINELLEKADNHKTFYISYARVSIYKMIQAGVIKKHTVNALQVIAVNPYITSGEQAQIHVNRLSRLGYTPDKVILKNVFTSDVMTRLLDIQNKMSEQNGSETNLNDVMLYLLDSQKEEPVPQVKEPLVVQNTSIDKPVQPKKPFFEPITIYFNSKFKFKS